MFREKLETLMCDDRLLEVRHQFERKIVERFIQNYVKGLREYKLIGEAEDSETKKPIFTVRFINSNTKYIVRNWNCTCNEL
jgi:hypothetical protein